MVERKKARITKAREQYTSLLNFHGVGSEIQKIAKGRIANDLRRDPKGTIKEIESWWEEAFGSNGDGNHPLTKEEKRQKDLDQLPPVQRAIYERRRRY